MKLSAKEKNLLFFTLEKELEQCKQDLSVIEKRKKDRELTNNESLMESYLETTIEKLDQLMTVLEKGLEQWTKHELEWLCTN